MTERIDYQAPGTDDGRIWDLWLTHTYQDAIVAADDGGMFAALHQEPATIRDLAARLDYDERAVRAIVRLMASLGLLVPRRERFHLTDPARVYLLKSSPFYWGHMMRVRVGEPAGSALLEALKKKEISGTAGASPDLPSATGKGRSIDGWATGRVSVQEARRVAERMHSHSLVAAIGAARNYDFAGVGRILDVGGGSGCFMIAIAQARNLDATVMELPAMCAVALEYIEAGGVAERVGTVAVDMFREPWPTGYDAVFFSNVFHDWNLRTCQWLAARAYEVLPEGGRIMLHEMLIDDDEAGPATAASFSVLMLLATQGQQFTLAELRSILEGAGFTGIETRPTSAYYSITTGYKQPRSASP